MSGGVNIQQVTPVVASTTEDGVIVEDTAAGTPKLTIITSSGTANTFGAWVEHDASVSADSWIAFITIMRNTSGKGPGAVLEIGVGAGGSEVTKIRLSHKWMYDTDAGYQTPAVFSLPIPIKAASGVRIAARIADDFAEAVGYKVSISYYQGLET